MIRIALTLLLVSLFTHGANAQVLQPPADGERTASGLITTILAKGSGAAHPEVDSVLRLRYSLSNSEGKVLAHVDAPRDVVLAVTKMIPGWREAALMMVEGERRRAWISESLGAKGKVAPGGFLVLDTELLEIIPGPRTPPDVAAPPNGALAMKGGLAYVILRAGEGTTHPTMRSTVRVHYSGWTTDGKLFDSSILRGQEAEFPLTGVIAGWQDVLREMVIGERVRVWIPERLAYRGERGKPRGTLVFDIELLEIER